MKLPSAEQAVVPDSKLTDYLLNPTHPEGRSKARFFLGLGFRREEPEALRRALLQNAEMRETVHAFGRKFVGAGSLNTPGGGQVDVVTVWVLRDNLPPPVLVTAYPAKHKER